MLRKEELIQKLFKGQCSRSELIQLFELIDQDPTGTAPDVMQALAEQLGDSPVLEPEISHRIYARVQAQVELEAEAATVRPMEPAQAVRPWRAWRAWAVGIAATTLLMAGVIWGVWQGQQPAMLSQQTQPGEIRELVLPDSSRVTLNGKSTLTYAPAWKEAEDRKVFLSGEAYFQVRKQPVSHARFLVVTPELTVEVLGTSFNVNSRSEQTDVFLEEGTVKINLEAKQEEPILMEPGELVSYAASKRQAIKTQQVKADEHVSWKTGVMIFEDAPLLDILNKLAAANDLQFEVRNERLKDLKFTSGLPIKDLDITLRALERMLGDSIRREGQRILIGGD